MYSSWVCTLLQALVKDDCFPLNTSPVLFAVLLPFNHKVQSKVEINSLPKSSLQCQARYPRETQLPSSSRTDRRSEQWRFAGITPEREGECRVTAELAKYGDYSLTWKIVPGKTVKTGSNSSLVLWEWWGNNGHSSLVECRDSF